MGDIEEKWRRMERRIKKVLRETKEKKGDRRRGIEGWWDEECRREKGR